MMKTIIAAIFFGILAGVLIAVFLLENQKNNSELDQSASDNEVVVDSFESCLQANYPIQESYPRRCVLPDGTAFTEDISVEIDHEIVLETPRPNSVIVSPVSVRGEAVGSWYFEGSFTAELVDANGDVLGNVILTAEGEWMTNELVPFTGELEFDALTTGSGELIFMSANPSGLEEDQMIFSIPVLFN